MIMSKGFKTTLLASGEQWHNFFPTMTMYWDMKSLTSHGLETSIATQISWSHVSGEQLPMYSAFNSKLFPRQGCHPCNSLLGDYSKAVHLFSYLKLVVVKL